MRGNTLPKPPKIEDYASRIARQLEKQAPLAPLPLPEETIGATSRFDEPTGPTGKPNSLPTLLAALAAEGDPVPTGFPPLDRQFRRGGLIPGSILVVGGPPHTGKTTLVEQIGLHMSQVVPVVALFADEGDKPAARRMASMLMVPDHILDTQPARAQALASDAIGERSFHFWPTESDFATVDQLIAWVIETFHGEHCVVILDSIQTIPLSRDDTPESPRLAAKALMSACRQWASQHSITFILTSQSNRASYRSKKTEDNSEAIASFSETGAIEYMADIAIVLALPDDSEIVQGRLVKNRLKGSAKPFALRFNLDTHTMSEADKAEVESAVILANSEKLAPFKTEIKSILEKHNELSGKEIEDLAFGNSTAIRRALKSMVHHDKSVSQFPRTAKGGGFLYSLRYKTHPDELT